MRIGWNRLMTGRLPFLPIFAAGLFLGMLFMNCGKEALLESTGLLDESALYHMKYMTVDSGALLVYVLGKRLGVVAVLAVLSTTYLGLPALCAASGWFGLLMGMFFSSAVIRYGSKGVLLAFTGIFPQYLFYIPAMVMTLLWCEQLCRTLCFRNQAHASDGGKHAVPERILRLLVIIALAVTGCLLESYVNPILMNALLKIF